MSISDRLDAIEARPTAWPWLDRAADDKRVLVAALRAALDLHKSESLGGTEFCEGCGPVLYPCGTVRAVTAALGEVAS